MDIRIENHGSIVVLYPRSQAGEDWMGEHLPSDAQKWGNGIVVEPRYVADIINGARNDGLEVGE